MAKKIDAVFEGGGVKGSALVGAVVQTEQLGYTFSNVAGTSAGAIVAALVAVGYTGAEIKKILDELDYAAFKDLNTIGKVPVLGAAYNLIVNKGVYQGDFFEQWIRALLAKKGVRTFGDLVINEYAAAPQYRYKLQVIASDISRGRLLVLPRDSAAYGIDPDHLEVARALRMSMSIPYFYRPVTIPTPEGAKSYIVDGGILSNYPLSIFDDESATPPWPTIGYKLVEPQENQPHRIGGPLTLFGALFSTMMEAHDARYIEDSNFVRTIPIPTLDVNTIDFDLTPASKKMLYESGLTAAKKFFDQWDFEAYKQRYRTGQPVHRSDRLRGQL